MEAHAANRHARSIQDGANTDRIRDEIFCTEFIRTKFWHLLSGVCTEEKMEWGA